MKKYIKISFILGIISLVCAVILAGINMLTEDTIKENETKTKNDTIKVIYEDYDSKNSITYNKKQLKEYNAYSSKVEERIVAKNKDNELLGYLYICSGSNSYGDVKLMIALNENNGIVEIEQVEFLLNTESYGSTVKSWLESNFYSKGTELHEGGFTSDSTKASAPVSSLALSEINTKCGASRGAELCMSLIEAACELEKEVA